MTKTVPSRIALALFALMLALAGSGAARAQAVGTKALVVTQCGQQTFQPLINGQQNYAPLTMLPNGTLCTAVGGASNPYPGSDYAKDHSDYFRAGQNIGNTAFGILGTANWFASQGSAGPSVTGPAVAARSGRASAIITVTANVANSTIYLGPSAGVATTNGIILPCQIGASRTISTAAAIYAVTNSGTCPFDVQETF